MKIPIQSAPVNRGLNAARVTQPDRVRASWTWVVENLYERQCKWAEYVCHGGNQAGCDEFNRLHCRPNPAFTWNQ